MDIGAGYGDIFDVSKILFHQSDGYVFEPDEYTQNSLTKKGVHVFKESFLVNKNYDNIKLKFDIIIMSHVLEHYNAMDVIAILKKLSHFLSQYGVLFIEVPCDDMQIVKDFRKNDAPHLSFFSMKALREALERAGMEVLYINTCGAKIEDYYKFTPPPLEDSIKKI